MSKLFAFFVSLSCGLGIVDALSALQPMAFVLAWLTTGSVMAVIHHATERQLRPPSRPEAFRITVVILLWPFLVVPLLLDLLNRLHKRRPGGRGDR